LDPKTAIVPTWGGNATLVASGRERGRGMDPSVPLVSDQDRNTPPASPERMSYPHNRQYSEPERVVSLSNPHRPQQSVDVPLLAAEHRRDESASTEPEASALSPYHPPELESPDTPRYPPSSPGRPPPLPSEAYHSPHHSGGDTNEFGDLGGMAGVGSASRRRIRGLEPAFQPILGSSMNSTNR
jgi:hypothetical protein